MKAIPTYALSFRSGLLLAGLAALLSGCGEKPAPPADAGPSLPPAAVRLQKIEAVSQPALEEVVGTVLPRLQAVLEAKVSGRITRLSAALGQSVKQGDVLVELATLEIQARLDQARAALRQAELDLNRTTRLHKQSAATQAELDAAQTRHQVAQAAVAEAEALAGYGRIAAPFDGVVARKLADEGDLAMPGKPLLELEGRAGLRLVADVPGLLAPRIRPAAELAVRVDAIPEPLTGTVAEIAPAADPASRTVRVKVDLPAAPGLRAANLAGWRCRSARPPFSSSRPPRGSGGASLRSCLSPPTAKPGCAWCAAASRPPRASRSFPGSRPARRSSWMAPRRCARDSHSPRHSARP